MSVNTATARGPVEWALLPLRAFLGATFTFAGLQKLANPAFFRASNPASIQAQLLAAARRSPIHGFLHHLVHLAVPIGVLFALAELAVGLGTMAGLLGRVAALGGLVISISLFLAVSFHTTPYYVGADIVFAFAWIPFIITGPGPLSVDALLVRVVPRVAPQSRGQSAPLGRRSVLLHGAWVATLAGVGALAAGLAAGIGRLVAGHASSSVSVSLGNGAAGPSTSPPTTPPTTTSSRMVGPSTTGGTPTSEPSSTTTSPSSTTTTATPHPPGTKLGPASRVPVGGAATFQDPRTGDPAVVVRPSQSTFLAFDAVCPHAGCTVEYDSSQRLFVCPCHGSEFNGRTGAVEVGPAQSGLRSIRIAEGSDGDLYAE